MHTYVTPNLVCPYCDEIMDRSSSLEVQKAEPKPGDVTLCLYCTMVSVYTPDLKLRKATVEEEKELAENPQVTRVQRAMRSMDRTKLHGGQGNRKKQEIPRLSYDKGKTSGS